MSKILFIVLLSGMLTAMIVSAQTVIQGGEVTGTWGLAGSPYLVYGDITVPGETGDPNPLTIEAGVEVIFCGHYKMIVNGILEAEGTESDSIYFTAEDTSAGWHGIRFINALYPSYLSFCVIQYGNAFGSGNEDNGGGIFCQSSSPVISYCTISKNDAEDHGGGIYCENSSPEIHHCTICENYAEEYGGGVNCTNSDLCLSKCTISQNQADDGGGGIRCTDNCSTAVVNCILWDNIGGQIHGDPQVTYSDIQGGWPGEGNINSDPLFINAAGSDYGLQWDSPCIDTGDPDPTYKDPDGTRADMGAYYYPHTLRISCIVLDFGLAIVGEPESFPLTVTNAIDSTVILHDFSTTDPSFTTDFNPADSLLLPGDSLIVTVTFAPPATGMYEDTLTIDNNYIDCEVELLGMGLEGGTPIEGGLVSGTWSASGSPYWINGEITVPAGETLNIEPGVEVCFIGHHKFVVYGFLVAVGTQTDSIFFTALNTNEGWHGIRFIEAPDSSHLSYCIIQYGRAAGAHPDDYGGGIYCEQSSPVIRHCTIRDNQSYLGGGIAAQDSANFSIVDCFVGGNLCDYTGGGMDISSSNPAIDNCTIAGNHSDYRGGGISCWQANPIISNCMIQANSSENRGGGISVSNASPTIDSCIIQGNSSALMGGGGIGCWFSSPFIINCMISGNWASHGDGGGIKCIFDDPHIENCIISSNSATYDGGGTYFDESSVTMIECTISENSAGNDGGGVRCKYVADGTLLRCIIEGNSADRGAGVALTGYNPTILACTVVQNLALSSAGGIYCDDSSPDIRDCILWADNPEEILADGISSPQVTYSDVMGGYTGIGNIAVDPQFVYPDQNDFRLQWSSPCIDAGDPNPLYDDPDGTRADMGACYYDQGMPQRILLTAHNAPVSMPAAGGRFDYTIWLTNIDPQAIEADVWLDVTLPDGNIFGPILGPVMIEIGSGQTLSRDRTQVVPASAPVGLYSYNAYAVVLADTSTDSFTWVKLGSEGSDWTSGWFNTGESFDELSSGLVNALLPEVYSLKQNYPNPFNPLTTIRFGLPEDVHVKITVFDVLGRQVVTLMNGRREAGYHDITFDGSCLASGVYIYRIQAGKFTAVGKMVLMK